MAEEPHSTVRQLGRHQLRGFGSENGQRPVLRAHERDLGPRAALTRMRRRQQCQLVQRQRPRSARWDGEHERVELALVKLLEKSAEARQVPLVAERQRPGDAHCRPRARGQHERVVSQSAAGPQPDPSPRAADTLNACPVISDAKVGGDRSQVKRAGGHVARMLRASRRDGRQTRGSGETSEIRTAPPASARSASTTSRAAKPPPATTTRPGPRRRTRSGHNLVTMWTTSAAHNRALPSCSPGELRIARPVATVAVLVTARRTRRAPNRHRRPGVLGDAVAIRIGSRNRVPDQAVVMPEPRSIKPGIAPRLR